MTPVENFGCNEVERVVDVYLDGEFDKTDHQNFENHVAQCEACRQRVHRQSEWRQALRAALPDEKAPSGLRERMLASLDEEPVPLASWRRWAMRTMPVAVAAGVLMVALVGRMTWRVDEVAADAVSKHRRNLPVEITGQPEQVRRWYADKVDFPVRPPTFSRSAVPVELRGGRLSHIGNREAAELMFDVKGSQGQQKMSVFIFDPGGVPLAATHKEVINNREVYFNQERGYNVVMYQENGVGYALASELDQRQMLSLVSAAVAPDR